VSRCGGVRNSGGHALGVPHPAVRRACIAAPRAARPAAPRSNGKRTGPASAAVCGDTPRRLVLVAAQEASGAAEITPGTAKSMGRFLAALYQFSRPHTMLGTLISVVSVSLLALQGAPITWLFVQGVVAALVPALLMNICIVGMNQLYDVEIDKINKPYLPLASGEFDMTTGVAVVCSTGLVSLGMGFLNGSVPLICTLVGSLALGVVYSTDLPFLRWKRFPVLAAGCILAVRAVAVQLGFYCHALAYVPWHEAGQSAAFGALLHGPLGFTVGFMLFFSIVIALFKDIPDTKGDVKADVRTLSVRFGVKKIFWTCIALLEVAYLGAIVYAASRGLVLGNVILMAGHAAMGYFLWQRARSVDLEDNRYVASL